MVNVYDKPGSIAKDFGFKNNTNSILSAGLTACEAGIVTDLGVWAFKDHAGTYHTSAPQSTITQYYIPRCKTTATGELENTTIVSNATAVTFNSAQGDIDFRVYGNGTTAGLFYDAANNYFGIGTTSPAARLEVKSAAMNSNPVLVKNSLGNTIFAITDLNTTQDGRIAIGDSSGTYRILLNTETTNPSYINAGNFGLGVVSPTAKLEIYNPKTSTPNYLNLQMQDMAHGMTTIAPTNVFGVVKAGNASGSPDGGLRIIGIADPDACYNPISGLELTGIIADTTLSGLSTLSIVGQKKNGTGVQALAADEKLLTIKNYTTTLATMLGNGYLGLVEETNPDLPIHISKTGGTSAIKFEQIGYGSWCVGVATGNPTSLALSVNDDLSSPAVLIAAAGSIVCSSTIQAAYKSSDGTAGATATIYSGFSSATFKDGILVSAT